MAHLARCPGCGFKRRIDLPPAALPMLGTPTERCRQCGAEVDLSPPRWSVTSTAQGASIKADLHNSSPCRCDFCTGKKSWSDNWCPQCANVRMQPPKWWENLDVCVRCARLATRENSTHA